MWSCVERGTWSCVVRCLWVLCCVWHAVLCCVWHADLCCAWHADLCGIQSCVVCGMRSCVWHAVLCGMRSCVVCGMRFVCLPNPRLGPVFPPQAPKRTDRTVDPPGCRRQRIISHSPSSGRKPRGSRKTAGSAVSSQTARVGVGSPAVSTSCQ